MAHKEIILSISFDFVNRDSKSSPKSIYHIKSVYCLGYKQIVRQIPLKVLFYNLLLFHRPLFCDKGCAMSLMRPCIIIFRR